MSFKVQDKATKNSAPRPLPKAGVRIGRLLHVVDLGVQDRPAFKGEVKPPVRQVMITFELCDDKMEHNGEQVPLRISTKPFTLSTDTKSSLFKFMSSLDPMNALEGDLAKYLNMPVMITVVHAEYQKNGETRKAANINGVMPVPEGIPVPECHDTPILFSFDEPTVDSYKAMPVWLRNKIKDAKNYSGSKVVAVAAQVPDEAEPAKAEKIVEEDDIPFEKPEQDQPKAGTTGAKKGKSPY